MMAGSSTTSPAVAETGADDNGPFPRIDRSSSKNSSNCKVVMTEEGVEISGPGTLLFAGAETGEGGAGGEVVVDVGSEYSYDYSSNDDGSSTSISLPSRVSTSYSQQSSSATSEYSHSHSHYWHEPIKVGYAFGPKKMTTMGVVMAEASRVQVIHEEPEQEDEDEDAEEGDEVGNDGGNDADEDEDACENELAFNSSQNHVGDRKKDTGNRCSDKASSPSRPPPATKLTSGALKDLADATSTPCADGDCSGQMMSTIISLKNTDETDIRHIVRYFRSNCSSAAASVAGSMSETTTTSTPTTAYGSCMSYTSAHDASMSHLPGQKQRGGGGAASSAVGVGRHQRRKRSRRHPVHISFVPLDCDQPLEEQHGGNFDLILHKLTEDILCCSLMNEKKKFDGCAVGNDRGSNSSIDGLNVVTVEDKHASRKRVQALKDYHEDHDYCCLVDDPSNVQTVMSRSDIALVLRDCLRGVHSASGVPVRSPRFVVIGDNENYPGTQGGDVHGRKDRDVHGAISYLQAERLKDQLQQEKISMPVIVKPLIAAGTKQSHSMLIALKESALPKFPCKSIAQEYVNHDATLYKVYVLGDFVSVFDRLSLPNLPKDISSRATADLVKFDSQRPYPKMSDFGLDDGPATNKDGTKAPSLQVTADEVRPIVNVLKNAFGLEMFGFDVLQGEDGEYLVVDVNYFPSYKEVKDFPFLLAQYLTQRVLEQRRKKRETEMSGNVRKAAIAGM